MNIDKSVKLLSAALLFGIISVGLPVGLMIIATDPTLRPVPTLPLWIPITGYLIATILQLASYNQSKKDDNGLFDFSGYKTDGSTYILTIFSSVIGFAIIYIHEKRRRMKTKA